MARTLKPIAKQVIVITGASSGIGLTTARMAASRGASVFLIARNGEALASAVAAIGDGGGIADFAVADVGSHEELRAAAARAVERFGRIDTWVNNAGVAIYAKLVDTPADEHERLFRTNYFGAVNGALIAVEHMRKKGGALITVGSIAADIGTPVMGAYAASKHAVKGYIDSLRLELNADAVPVSVTLIKPSGIDTPIGAHAANHQDGEALIPPPVYAPELVANAILDAAENTRLEVTVGGVGRAQVLLATHFPWLFSKFGGQLAPALHDADHAKTPGDNLDSAGSDGEERSNTVQGRTFSLYQMAGRHGALAAVAGAASVGALVAFARRSKRLET